MLQLLSDERLARRGAGGDEHAFEAIYRRYNQELYRFCLAMTGDAQDAQEALQNTMLKVLRALPGERRRIKLKPWLYRIARNESIEVIRRRRDNEELEVDVPTTGTVAEAAETRERLRALLGDLEELPERQRAALLMRELSGCEFEEIGATFGTSAAVARQTLYEARLGLRELEEGRERHCADVRHELSDGDGRVLRSRRTRAHLRDCPECRAFGEAISERQRTLAGLAPLPLVASAGMLNGVLTGEASAAGTGGGGLAGALGAGVGQTAITSVTLKSVATVAVAVVAATAADRTGVVDLPLPGGDRPAATRHAAGHAGSASDERASDANATGVPTGPGVTGDQPRHSAQGGGGKSEGTQVEHAHRGDSGHSSSETGPSPPGGGYGRSAAERGGQPEELPDAAARGHETAAAKKPPGTPGPPSSPGEQGQSQKPAIVLPPRGRPEAPGTPPVETPASPPAGKGPPSAKPPAAPAEPPVPPAGPPETPGKATPPTPPAKAPRH